MRARAQKLKTLERRLNYLRGQVSIVDKENVLAWIKAEIAALDWALPILTKIVEDENGENGSAISL